MIGELWNRTVVPWAVELCCAGSSVERQRAKIMPRVEGRVLEIGIGSGLNLAHYDAARVSSVVGLDPSPELLAKARPRAEAAAVPVTLLQSSAERLALDAASFDAVVATYTFCSIQGLDAALAEVRRVLRPGGTLWLSEHGLAPDPGPRGWQRRLDPVWSRVGGGCHLDRDVRGYLERAGFATDALESMYLPGPRWLSWHTWGPAPLAGG